MSVTGIMLVLFLLGHLCGNLLIFLGPEALNAYAKKLHALGPILWVIRSGLLIVVGLHIWTSWVLAHENRAARPTVYAKQDYLESTLAARSMLLSGLLVLAFIVFHIMHFTWKITHPEFATLIDVHGHADVYTMVVIGFQEPLIAVAYVVAVFLLCVHLSHGAWSAFQTLGLTTPASLVSIRWAARLMAVLFFLGFSSIPLSVLLGFVGISGGLR